MLDDLVLRNDVPREGVLVQLTLQIIKIWHCDYRDCEESKEEKKTGRRGEQPHLYGEIPQHSDWVKINFSGGGRSETLHFCTQDCAEKELNLLTQQGLSAPAPQPVLGRGDA